MTEKDAVTLTAWATVATAFFTMLLFGGVFFAARAYRAQVRSSRIVETGSLIEQWREKEIEAAYTFADREDNHDKNRKLARRFYTHVHVKERRYRTGFEDVDKIIQDIAKLAERTEIYLRKHVADESIIVEHLGYEIVAAYYHYQDVLQDRAAQLNLDYEAPRSLALRVQDYARLHPKEANLEKELVWAYFPPLRYKNGEVSDSHKPPLWRQVRLYFVKPPIGFKVEHRRR